MLLITQIGEQQVDNNGTGENIVNKNMAKGGNQFED